MTTDDDSVLARTLQLRAAGPSHPLIRFRTRRFDLADEPDNPINPIHGWSLLEWLRTQPPLGATLSETAAEDWGWYAIATVDGRCYLIGASAEESTDGNHAWTVLIDKQRSLWEKLLGRARMTADDACFRWLCDAVAREPQFTDLSAE